MKISDVKDPWMNPGEPEFESQGHVFPIVKDVHYASLRKNEYLVLFRKNYRYTEATYMYLMGRVFAENRQEAIEKVFSKLDYKGTPAQSIYLADSCKDKSKFKSKLFWHKFKVECKPETSKENNDKDPYFYCKDETPQPYWC